MNDSDKRNTISERRVGNLGIGYPASRDNQGAEFSSDLMIIFVRNPGWCEYDSQRIINVDLEVLVSVLAPG